MRSLVHCSHLPRHSHPHSLARGAVAHTHTHPLILSPPSHLRVQGIEVLERIPIPPEMIPADAHVEIDAKVAVGYHGGQVHAKLDETGLKVAKGRHYGEKGDPLKPGFQKSDE